MVVVFIHVPRSYVPTPALVLDNHGAEQWVEGQ